MFGLRWSGEIELAEVVVREADLPLPVGLRAWAQADGQSCKGTADIPSLAAEGDRAVNAHDSDGRAAGVVECGQSGRQTAWARPVVTHGRIALE